MQRYSIDRFYSLENDFLKSCTKLFTRNDYYIQIGLKLVKKKLLVNDSFLELKYRY